jgi:hypothetical protein
MHRKSVSICTLGRVVVCGDRLTDARCTQATGKVSDLQTELDKARKRAEQTEKALQQLRQSRASPLAHTPTSTPANQNQNQTQTQTQTQTSLPVARSSSGGTQRPLASPVSGAPPVAAGGAGFNAGNRVFMYCMLADHRLCAEVC